MSLKWHLMKDAKKLTHDFIFQQAFNIRIFFLIFFFLLFCNILTFLVPEALWLKRLCPLLLCTSKWRSGPTDYSGLTNDTNVSYPFYLCVWSPDALCHCTKLHMKSINSRKMAIKQQFFKSRESKLLVLPR